MKVYSIIITITAVIALGLAGYLYWQGGEIKNNYNICQSEKSILMSERDMIAKDKAKLNDKVNLINEQLDKINRTAVVLNYALNSFMFAGDIKALTIGSQEAEKVKEAINQLTNKDERMMAEGYWNDFKSTRLFNPLFGLLRALADSINREASLRP
ncbi:MAG: hypothetical protein ACPLW9_02935 [Minisyncoccales bacterium]